MDAKEAIKYLKSMLFTADMSESTLKEIAVNKMAISALEKQVPKEPVVSNENYDEIEYLCPVCNRLVGNMNYCLSCGQRLNWGK